MIGIPVGIWCLRALNRNEIKRGFAREALRKRGFPVEAVPAPPATRGPIQADRFPRQTMHRPVRHHCPALRRCWTVAWQLSVGGSRGHEHHSRAATCLAGTRHTPVFGMASAGQAVPDESRRASRPFPSTGTIAQQLFNSFIRPVRQRGLIGRPCRIDEVLLEEPHSQTGAAPGGEPDLSGTPFEDIGIGDLLARIGPVLVGRHGGDDFRLAPRLAVIV